MVAAADGRRTTTTGQEAAPSPVPTPTRPPTVAEAFAVIAEFGRALTGGEPLTDLRLVYTFAGGRRGSIPVPIPADENDKALGEMAAEMLVALRKFKPGEWLNGAALAGMLRGEPNRRDTTFKRAITELKDANLIESSGAGYRLPSGTSEGGPNSGPP